MKAPLSISHPKLAAEWHPTKNGSITPDQVVAGSSRKVWWQCSKGPDHEWQARLSSRTKGGNGCPYCASRKVVDSNSFASLFPEIIAQWHPTKNGVLTP